jgi:hypothetical protein
MSKAGIWVLISLGFILLLLASLWLDRLLGDRASDDS